MMVKPAPGRAVRDPVTRQLLPEAGRDVPDNTFWHRRLRDGDVIAVDDKKQVRAAAKPAPAATKGDA